MARPGFWDDQEKAQPILQERTRLQAVTNSWQKQRTALDEVEEFLLLMEEEGEDETTMQEVRQTLQDIEQAFEQIEFERMLSGENDEKNAIVAINSGAGGTEAQDWAEMLLRMYLKWCDSHNFTSEIIDYQPGEEAGIKSVTFTATGPYTYGYLKADVGIHRLVRISPFDAGSRRHTSFASVFVYPEVPDEIAIDVNEEDLRVDTYRSSGAGGQHVNKTDSAVRITHLPTGIVVQCQNERSQHKNRAMAMKILRARLYDLRQQEMEDDLAELHKSKKEIAWGSQIRSYTLQPYRLVKDHRTGIEKGNVDAVLDGELDDFIRAYLLQAGGETK